MQFRHHVFLLNVSLMLAVTNLAYASPENASGSFPDAGKAVPECGKISHFMDLNPSVSPDHYGYFRPNCRFYAVAKGSV